MLIFWLTVQEVGFFKLDNRLAVGERVLDPHPHHDFGNFTDTKISLKKVQSILYTMIKKKNQLFLLAVANFLGKFSWISTILSISIFYELLRKKSKLRQFTWLVAKEIVSYFFAFVSILPLWTFFRIFCIFRIPGFHEFIVKMMTSWSLWVYQSDSR